MKLPLLPFDIELAKLAQATGSGKIVTRGEEEVIITKWNDSINPVYPLVGRVGKRKVIRSWTTEGKYFSDRRTDFLDLFIKELC